MNTLNMGVRHISQSRIIQNSLHEESFGHATSTLAFRYTTILREHKRIQYVLYSGWTNV